MGSWNEDSALWQLMYGNIDGAPTREAATWLEERLGGAGSAGGRLVAMVRHLRGSLAEAEAPESESPADQAARETGYSAGRRQTPDGRDWVMAGVAFDEAGQLVMFDIWTAPDADHPAGFAAYLAAAVREGSGPFTLSDRHGNHFASEEDPDMAAQITLDAAMEADELDLERRR